MRSFHKLLKGAVDKCSRFCKICQCNLALFLKRVSQMCALQVPQNLDLPLPAHHSSERLVPCLLGACPFLCLRPSQAPSHPGSSGLLVTTPGLFVQSGQEGEEREDTEALRAGHSHQEEASKPQQLALTPLSPSPHPHFSGRLLQ